MSHDWSLTVGRVLGTSHRKSGLPCQDDAIFRTLERARALVIAVSDGAGSGRLTHFASAVAVRSSTFFIGRSIDSGLELGPGLIRESFRVAATDVGRLSDLFKRARRTVNEADFACTLIVVAVQREKLLLGQLGDGALVVSGEDGLRCLSPPQDREYLNETIFLNSARAARNLHIGEHDVARIRAFGVMSDGVQHLGIKYQSNEPYERFFSPIFDYAVSHRDSQVNERSAELDRFLDSDKVNSETDDDKTLVVAIRGADHA